MCVLHARARLQPRTRTRVCFLIKKGGGVNWFFCFCFCVVVVWVPSTVRTASVCASASAGVGVCFSAPCRASRVCFVRAGPGPLKLNVSFAAYSFVVLLFRWDYAPTRRGCSGCRLRATRSS
ncbi:hypothetical protein BC826DRAFT_425135 [Russula brevipes]|nr:hypothetical protein BC826DRAFT_425135 [Russula brevipes]